MVGRCVSRLLLAAGVIGSCKGNNPLKAGTSQSTQAKPDKTSEEPTGLPGYPLACRWLSYPTQQSPSEGTIDCFLSDAKREPVTLNPAPEWSASYPDGANIVTELINPIFRIKITASESKEVLKVVQDIEIHVKANGAEQIAKGRDCLKPNSGQWRIGTACGNGFAITIVDSQGIFININAARFDGCDVLANRLLNVVVPNAAFRNLPDTHKTVVASCNNELFDLSLTSGQNIVNVGILSTEACQDLRSLIHSVGI